MLLSVVLILLVLSMIPSPVLSTYTDSGEYVQEDSANPQDSSSSSAEKDSEQAEQLLREIVRFGIDESDYLTNVKERHLYEEGVALKKTDPAHFVAVFNKQKKPSKEISKYAYASLHASSLLARQ
jgi:hypothetical protein